MKVEIDEIELEETSDDDCGWATLADCAIIQSACIKAIPVWS